MNFAKPLFASPAKRLAATAIDAALITCCTWFALNLLTREWYPVEAFAWGLPLGYWVYESACLINMNGASVGRRLFDIQVVSAFRSGELSWWQGTARPGARVALYAMLVLYLSPAPARRFDIITLPLLMEIGLLFTTASLTFSDIVARTRVVNTPPLQPHRAPAAPMYSPTDAEFGYPPRQDKQR
jgi:hypothetical protein